MRFSKKAKKAILFPEFTILLVNTKNQDLLPKSNEELIFITAVALITHVQTPLSNLKARAHSNQNQDFLVPVSISPKSIVH